MVLQQALLRGLQQVAAAASRHHQWRSSALSCGCSRSGPLCSDDAGTASTSASAAGTYARAFSSSSHSASAAAYAAAPRGKQRGKAGGEPPAPAAADAAESGDDGGDAALLAQLRGTYQRSRMDEFWKDVLARELMLKLNVESVHQLPRVRKVDVAIQARALPAGTSYANKWELLLPALGLEYVTGRAATLVTAKQKYYANRGAVTAARVSLRGAAAHDFLEKLAYLVLPSQNAFEGLLMRSLDRLGHLHFTVPRMINFPDYEDAFETFENLGSVQVSVVMDNVARRPARSRVLLTGLQVPLFARKKRVGDDDDAGGGDGAGGGGAAQAADA